MTCRFCGKEDGRVFTMPVGGFCQCVQREGDKLMHLTDEQRRMLTEKLLGECWTLTATVRQCADCTYSCPISTRTFTTPQDLIDCKKALVKKGLWSDFCEWTAFEQNYNAESLADEFEQWSDWLFSTERFCELVATFILTNLPIGDT